MQKRYLMIVLVLAVAVVTASLTYATATSKRELATIRQATAKYHQLEAALADGYEPLFDCTLNPTDPTLAMGQHYINGALVSDDVLELEKPEVLMYEPQSDDSMKLVGVEYVIFEDAWTGENPPEFLGRTMARKTAVGVHEVPAFYEVHAWVWSHNPHGDFADWNPEITCR
ncbi:MAG: hypothetical protein KatS3mg057_1208 [Herpetosiphonaceae bacterium]|nr:MAG: hypothetical protein KatS3mg057_1208 [Herpetosiphonaceae bacterium]